MSLGAKHQVIGIDPNAVLRWTREGHDDMWYFIGRIGDPGQKLSGLHLSPVKAWEDALQRINQARGNGSARSAAKPPTAVMA